MRNVRVILLFLLIFFATFLTVYSSVAKPPNPASIADIPSGETTSPADDSVPSPSPFSATQGDALPEETSGQESSDSPSGTTAFLHTNPYTYTRPVLYPRPSTIPPIFPKPPVSNPAPLPTKMSKFVVFPAPIEEVFPDPGLASYIAAELGMDTTQEVELDALLGISTININEEFAGPTVQSIEGIEYLSGLTSIFLEHQEISDLTPLELLDAPNLWMLSISFNYYEDIAPISHLTSLTHLYLKSGDEGYYVTDISPLSSLSNLLVLNLGNQRITDLSPLEGLDRLDYLVLGYNEILGDISSLSYLSTLRFLYLDANDIYDLSPLAGVHENFFILKLNNNHIASLAPLGHLVLDNIDRELSLENQEIPMESVYFDVPSLTIENPLRDFQDVPIPPDIPESMGSYDPDTNLITLLEPTESAGLIRIPFSKEYSYNQGLYTTAFSGEIVVPFTKPAMNEAPTVINVIP